MLHIRVCAHILACVFLPSCGERTEARICAHVRFTVLRYNMSYILESVLPSFGEKTEARTCSIEYVLDIKIRAPY